MFFPIIWQGTVTEYSSTFDVRQRRGILQNDERLPNAKWLRNLLIRGKETEWINKVHFMQVELNFTLIHSVS